MIKTAFKFFLYLFGGASVLLAISLWMATRPVNYDQMSKQRTLATIGDLKFLMASLYIWNPAHRGSGSKQALNLYAYLPDLTPEGPDNLWIRQMPGGNVSHAYQIHISSDMVPAAQAAANFIRMSKPCDGFSLDLSEGIQTVTCASDSHTAHYIYSERGKIIALMHCTPEGAAPSPGCNATLDYSANVGVKISFDAKRRKEILQIRNDVFGLLDRFRADAERVSN